MKKAVIFVFSGTGNTLRVAGQIAGRLDRRGVAAEIVEVRRPFEPAKTVDFEYAGFGYPIHAFNTPKIFLDYVNTLPRGGGVTSFIFKTSGEPLHFNDASSYALHKALESKGYDVAFESHLLMPYNIMFRYNDGAVKQMCLKSAAQSRLIADMLVDGVRRKRAYKLRHRLASFIFRVQWPGARLNGRLYSVRADKCLKCARCVKNCPAANISLDCGKIKFGKCCAMCMRCAMYCPADAIDIGALRRWKVNGPYEFERILSDANIPQDAISNCRKGFFRMFGEYYRLLDEELDRYEKQNGKM